MSEYIYNEKLKDVIKDLKKATKRKCYQIFLEKGKPEILDDKIGGKPYLPVGEEYPRDSNGNPMELLLQANLKNINLKDFPKQGILEIFVSVPLEYSPSENVVRIYEEGLEYQTRFPKLNHVDEEQIINKRAYKISFDPAVEFITLGHYKLGELLAESLNKHFGTNLTSYADELDEFFNNGEYYRIDYSGEKDNFFWSTDIAEMISEDEKITPSTFGGYAEFIQGDIRDFECKDKDVCICKLTYLKSKDKKMKTDGNLVGEGGCLNVLISKKDLKKQKFEDVIVAWDCD